MAIIGQEGEKKEEREEKRKKRGKRNEKEKEGWGIAFWNVAGLERKEKDFFKGLEEWEVIIMTETWVEEKGWKRVKRRLPKGYKWEARHARREKKKGRAAGGMVVGIREGIQIKQTEGEIEEEGIVAKTIRVEGQRWRIIGVYVNGDLEEEIERIRAAAEQGKGVAEVIVGGGGF